jgi:DNA-binding YbaB/EbfC family protein
MGTLTFMNRQPDMRQIMQQAQKMQEQLAKAQEELAAARFEGSAGGGVVTAVVTGGPELVEVKISRDVVDPEDVEMLEDLVVAAVRQAMEAAVEAANSQLGGLTGGMDMGGLLG